MERKTLASQFLDVGDHGKVAAAKGFAAYAPPDFAAAIQSDPDPSGLKDDEPAAAAEPAAEPAAAPGDEDAGKEVEI